MSVSHVLCLVDGFKAFESVESVKMGYISLAAALFFCIALFMSSILDLHNP
jgi:hypothetical protein